ncbi:hypothetical protein BH23BAC1_BH23BAC1_22680 [soil metagenome]
MTIINFSSLDPHLAIFMGLILTYLIHSTVFYLLVRLVLLFNEFHSSQVKEYLWRVALFGGIFTASFQIFSGLSLMSLPTSQNPKPSPVVYTVKENPQIPDRVIYEIQPEDVLMAVETLKAKEMLPVDPSISTIEIAKNNPTSISEKVLFFMGILFISFILLIYKILAYCQFINKIKPLDKVKDQKIHLMIHDLCTSIPYRKRITIKSSRKLKSPVALGSNKIFVPESSLQNLPDEQIKSLLAHELAHLVRKDTWWNAVYSFMEAALFFQPLNRMIRKELQENAEILCDEWAVKITGNKKALASCLLEVAGWYTKPITSSIVPGMALSKKSLTQRINNILNDQYMKTRPNFALTIFVMLTIGLLVILATPGFTIAPQQEAPKPEQPAKPKPEVPSQELKSIIPVDPKENIKKIKELEVMVEEDIEIDVPIQEEIDLDMDMDLDMDIDIDLPPPFKDDFKSFEEFNHFDHNFSFQFNSDDIFQLRDSILKNFEINFDDHFKENFNYVFSFQDGDTNKIRSRSSSIIINNNEKKVIIENWEVKELWIDGKKIPDDEIKNHNIVIEDFNPRIRFHEDAQGRLREAELRSKDAEIRAKDAELRAQEAQVRWERRREEIEIRKGEFEARRIEAESRLIEAEERRKEAEIRRMESEERRATAEKFNKILEENLIKDKLIEDADYYSFQLNNEELKINDVAQPEKIHKKYKKLYENETGNSLNENSNFMIRKK